MMETENKNHTRIRPDAASITAGLVFIGIGLVYLLSSDGHLHAAAQWTGSVLVLGLGLAWVIGAITRRRR
jgi:drug/metabolite transporter (DMT)-like permease